VGYGFQKRFNQRLPKSGPIILGKPTHHEAQETKKKKKNNNNNNNYPTPKNSQNNTKTISKLSVFSSNPS